MTVGELKAELEKWDDSDEIIVKIVHQVSDMEYDIEYIGEYYDWSNKEGGSSPAIIIEDRV